MSFLSEEQVIFEGGKNKEMNSEGIFGYRIPALLKTQEGTLIAGADERHLHNMDWGNIDMVVRRSEDNGETWGEKIVVADLQTNPDAEDKESDSALLIDMALLQDPKTGRIFSVYDMYPEQRGLFGMMKENRDRVENGEEPVDEEQYTELDGKHYLNLYHEDGGDVYTVREKGIVHDPAGKPTEYRVVLTSETAPYNDLGDLYKGDELVDNVYFTTNKKGPFRIAKESYMWISHSDDDGKTWSCPRDITPQVKLPWMKFYGVGPGVGIVLEHGDHKGRLVFATYATNHSYELDYSQSARVIYSDDHGETWVTGAAVNDDRPLENGEVIHSSTMHNHEEQNTEAVPVELNNGLIKLFMRNRKGMLAAATSRDGGETWDETIDYYEDVPEVYVQMSAVQTVQDGQEYIVLTNANGPDRNNGYARVAKVEEDGSLTWLHHKLIQEGEFAYNALQQIGPDTFACLYEHTRDGGNYFTFYFRTFDWAFLTSED